VCVFWLERIVPPLVIALECFVISTLWSKRVLRADRKADVNQTCQQSVFSPIRACIRIWCTVGAVERWSQMFVYRPFRFSLSLVPHSTKGLFTGYLYLWPFHIYLLRSQHIECIARREPSFNSDSTSKTDENSRWCQKNPKSKSCPWLRESSWKQVEQLAKFIFTSQEAFSCTGAGNRA